MKTNQAKKAQKLAADKAKGIKSMTLPMGPSDHAKLLALVERFGYEDWREMLTRLINVVHDEPWPDQLPVPRHDFKPSEIVLKLLERQGQLQSNRMDSDE